VGVLGGSGGVGASTFAAALAAAVGSVAVLIDADPVSGGVDVLLGIEAVPGARWSGVRLDGGHLDPELLEGGLPRWEGVRVLAADTAPTASDLVQVIDAANQVGPVIVDLPRVPGELRDAALAECLLAVVVTSSSVAPLAAARRTVATLPDLPVGIVLRRGAVSRADAAEILGAPVLAVLPESGRPRAGVPTSWIRTGRAVLDGILERQP
jgi:MinD-like ATPase involved in chromosome partitioning or flagellar assembly